MTETEPTLPIPRAAEDTADPVSAEDLQDAGRPPGQSDGNVPEGSQGGEPATDGAGAPVPDPGEEAGSAKKTDDSGGAPEDEEAEEPVTAPGMEWYVLRVASNKEEQVREALERKVKIEGLSDRVGRILVPTLKEKRMRAGVLKIVERKLYPGYVFVEMACEEDGSVAEDVWFLIKETSGVGDFIGSDGKPTSMPEHDVLQMLVASQKAEEQPGLSGLNLHKGDQVKISDGAFENYEGEVEEVDERRGMVSVIVPIFGRPTPVEVEYWRLEKVE